MHKTCKKDTRVLDGSTALHIAARNGHTKIIDFFLAKGLDPEIKNNDNQTYKDVLFIRPKTIKIDPLLCAQYSGFYQPEVGGPPVNIHLENNRLYYYAFGKDELYPLSEIRFITSAEVKYFEFIKDNDGNVKEFIYSSGTLKVRAKRIK